MDEKQTSITVWNSDGALLFEAFIFELTFDRDTEFLKIEFRELFSEEARRIVDLAEVKDFMVSTPLRLEGTALFRIMGQSAVSVSPAEPQQYHKKVGAGESSLVTLERHNVSLTVRAMMDIHRGPAYTNFELNDRYGRA